jgi:hypothetical protein
VDTDKYAVPLDALERSAHVAVEDQVSEHPEPPAPDVVNEERLAERWILHHYAG